MSKTTQLYPVTVRRPGERGTPNNAISVDDELIGVWSRFAGSSGINSEFVE